MNEQQSTKTTKLKWYLSSTFIGILFLVGGLLLSVGIGIIFLILGIIFLVMQSKALKPIYTKVNAIDDVDAYKANANSEIIRNKDATVIELQNKKQEADNELYNIQLKINNNNSKLDSLKKDITNAKAELEALVSDIKISYISPYSFDENMTSEEYKNKLSILRLQQNEFMKSDSCIILDSSITSPSKRALNNNTKQLLRCFNSESSNIISNVSVKNVDTCRSKLQKTFEALNKLFITDGVSLNKKCLENKLDELTLIYNYQLKTEQEREQQRAIKEQMVEEEKVRREIEREKAKIEKEEKQFKNEIQKLMTYLQKASDIEKQLYVDKITELESKVKLLEKDKENVLQREQNTRAGFVYIISNIGSFGENVYKIGMTRRLEPMDRIKELGSASVPFEFDVHAMIFSDDAPTLENILHKTFEKNAVNKVNLRKEFYKVDLHEVEKIVKQHHNATVTFTEFAKAEQYRESLKLAQIK